MPVSLQITRLDSDDYLSLEARLPTTQEVAVVSSEDARRAGLDHVAPSVLNFRRDMLFGGRHKRESAEEQRLRREKAAFVGQSKRRK